MFKTLKAIERANKKIGHHWFDKDTKSFFGSIVYPEIYGGKYFISWEYTYDGKHRRYTIRMTEENGAIKTVGNFLEFDTISDARARINELLKGE
jgi:hypothetical protein